MTIHDIAMSTTWRSTFQPARFGTLLADGRVQCGLCPRHCTLREGQQGFCGVRGVREGKLVTFNWGKSVHPTEETIETEAVFHYAPGSRILSMGNIGCMMNCSYCHNWKTSQSKYVVDADVHQLSPEGVVETALRHGIQVLSWTYNDPVVWHEFVVETATLARRHGLRNLYKSAFYITPQAIDELIPVMDIFSLSLKSMDPAYYRKLTKGELAPVLDGIRQVHRSGKHLEVSNLMITDVSDDETTAETVARFVCDELSPDVPLHFVRFHPDYRMKDTIRTPIDRLERAREVGLRVGVQHVYLGNVYGTTSAHTNCHACGTKLVERHGLRATLVGLADDGTCRTCGVASGVIAGMLGKIPAAAALPTDARMVRHTWQGDVRSLHVQARNSGATAASVLVRSVGGTAWATRTLAAGESYRFLVAMGSADEVGVDIAAASGVETNVHDVLDRAHFPVSEDVALEPESVS